jgi:hypothetical protein
MRNNLLLSMHGHGKAANRCLGQKRSANLSLSAYMQVGGANETNGQRCFSSRQPFVHDLVFGRRKTGRPSDQCALLVGRRFGFRIPGAEEMTLDHP